MKGLQQSTIKKIKRIISYLRNEKGYETVLQQQIHTEQQE